ncbi:hypothetical protein EAE96_003401 [Botrytis aclada]|nr:hypothetical protein EAE96_003401 [Botrytis aclada]
MIFIAFFYDSSRRWKNTSNSTGFCSQIARFDLAGTFAFISATICLLLALSWGGTTYAWGNVRIIVLLALAGILFCSFFGIEFWMKDSAIIPLRLLRRRSIIAAIWFGLCLGGVFFVNVFYIPLWFQIVDGVSVIKSSIHDQCRWRIYVCWLWDCCNWILYAVRLRWLNSHVHRYWSFDDCSASAHLTSKMGWISDTHWSWNRPRRRARTIHGADDAPRN